MNEDTLRECATTPGRAISDEEVDKALAKVKADALRAALEDLDDRETDEIVAWIANMADEIEVQE